jgi:hypothetical protein
MLANLVVEREEALGHQHAQEDAGNGFARAEDALQSVSVVCGSFFTGLLNFAIDVDDDFRADVDAQLGVGVLAGFEKLLHVLEHWLEAGLAVADESIFEFGGGSWRSAFHDVQLKIKIIKTLIENLNKAYQLNLVLD